MEELQKELSAYLDRVLHTQATIRPWEKNSLLPNYLLHSYTFWHMDLFKRSCLLIVAKEDIEMTPGILEKHRRVLQDKFPESYVIFVHEAIASYHRRDLIKHGVSFIDLHHQMFLPEMGIDLKERLSQAKAKVDFFSPATQLTLLYALLHDGEEEHTPLILSKTLGYSPMTLTRVFNELENFSVGFIEQRGKERCWKLNDTPKAIWQQTQGLMKSPVKHYIGLEQPVKQSFRAGLTALADYSMLATPPFSVRAVSLAAWQEIKKSSIAKELLPPDHAPYQLEVWRYDPKFLAKEGNVDPLSLYLSLKDNHDERVEAALDEMMEKLSW